MSTLASSTGRKAEHLRIAAGPGTQHSAGSGLERVQLRHRALPGRDLDDVDLTTDLLGARLAAPLVVSAMTGGTPEAEIARLGRTLTVFALAAPRGTRSCCWPTSAWSSSPTATRRRGSSSCWALT